MTPSALHESGDREIRIRAGNHAAALSPSAEPPYFSLVQPITETIAGRIEAYVAPIEQSKLLADVVDG